MYSIRNSKLINVYTTCEVTIIWQCYVAYVVVVVVVIVVVVVKINANSDKRILQHYSISQQKLSLGLQFVPVTYNVVLDIEAVY